MGLEMKRPKGFAIGDSMRDEGIPEKAINF